MHAAAVLCAQERVLLCSPRVDPFTSHACVQWLVTVDKDQAGMVVMEPVMGVAYVPLTPPERDSGGKL